MDVGLALRQIRLADYRLVAPHSVDPQLKAYFNSHFVPLTESPDWLYIRSAPR